MSSDWGRSVKTRVLVGLRLWIPFESRCYFLAVQPEVKSLHLSVTHLYTRDNFSKFSQSLVRFK